MAAAPPEGTGRTQSAPTSVRLATYNVEWFNALFDRNNRLLDDDGWSARYNVTRAQQVHALGRVFQTLDADGVMVIEAPDFSGTRNTVVALERFAERFGLRARRAVIGFSNDTQQQIAFLYDPDRLTPHHDPHSSASAPQFDAALLLDLDTDDKAEEVVFSKPPLELALEVLNGARLRVIGVHAKSKAPYGGRDAADVQRIAIANRRKQLAQCIWLRRRVEGYLAEGEAVVVMGDLNDGPGLDEFEQLFGRSGVEIVMGLAEPESARLFDPHPHMALRNPLGPTPATARFFNQETRRYLSVLLDYILVSSDLAAQPGAWRIWHPFDDPECWADEGLRDALLTASDHFPVTWDVVL